MSTALWRLTMAVILLLGALAVALAQGPQIARVERASGPVSVIRGTAPLPVKSGDLLYEGDVVSTGPAGSVTIMFNDKTIFSTGPQQRAVAAAVPFQCRELDG